MSVRSAVVWARSVPRAPASSGGTIIGRLLRLALRVVLLVCLPIVAVAAGLAFYLHGGRWITTENAYLKADIGVVSSDVAGRVIEIAVRDHQVVKAGDVLMRLDPEPFRLALAMAEADIGLARNMVETLRAAHREARTEVGEAEARLAYAEKNLMRQAALAQQGATAAAKLDEAQNEARVAREKLNVARQKVLRVLAGLGGDPNRTVEEHPQYLEARAKRDRAALELEKVTIVAPISGIAANVKAQHGEFIKAATPIFTIIGTERVWVEANLKETELTHIRVGQPARVVVDAYPDAEWQAVVESISPAAGSEFALLPPQNASGNWVKVVQRVPVRLRLEAAGPDLVLRAGMTVTAGIDTGRSRSLAGLIGGVVAAARPAAE